MSEAAGATMRIKAIDVDVGSELIRVVTAGLPDLRATEPVGRLAELRAGHDDFRRFVIEPPRGHADVNACLLYPPCAADAAGTIVVAPHIGYVPIAGTPLMAAATAAVDLGLVAAEDGRSTVRLDTAKGVAEIELQVANRRAEFATWLTTRPRTIMEQVDLELENGPQLSASIISPGLPYVVAEAASLGVDMDDLTALSAIGPMVIRSAARTIPLGDIGLADEASTYAAMIIGEISEARQGQPAKAHVAWVAPDGWVGPSPAGTGAITAATFLTSQGRIAVGEPIEVLGPSGVAFRCQVDDEAASVDVPVRIVAYLEFPADGLPRAP